MNSKTWIRKALSTCLVATVVASYSMVALAGTGKVAGELSVIGKGLNGAAPSVKVNGENAQSGRSIFSSSTVVTSENAGAVINIGKVGKLELAPNTTLSLNFDDKKVSGDLSAGKVTVLNSSEAVSITTLTGKTLTLKAGQTANAAGSAQDDDDDATSGGAAWLPWALIFGGAVAGIVVAAVVANNDAQLGGGTVVISPTR